MIIQLLQEVINMVKDDSKSAVHTCLSYVNTPSSSPSVIRKAKPVEDSEAAKVYRMNKNCNRGQCKYKILK